MRFVGKIWLTVCLTAVLARSLLHFPLSDIFPVFQNNQITGYLLNITFLIVWCRRPQTLWIQCSATKWRLESPTPISSIKFDVSPMNAFSPKVRILPNHSDTRKRREFKEAWQKWLSSRLGSHTIWSTFPSANKHNMIICSTNQRRTMGDKWSIAKC